MPIYEVLFKLSPPAVFGLPDGEKIVVPVALDGKERKLRSGAIDTRTGIIASHGTLPEYRQDDEAVQVDVAKGGLRMTVRDNFLRVYANADDAEEAYGAATELVDLVCQTMAAQIGVVFRSSYLSTQDAEGDPHSVRRPRSLQFLNAAIYNTRELQERLETSFAWSTRVDERGRKALLYFEHGCLLAEFAQTLPMLSNHAAFSWGLAFLQLYKALATILGEPGTDSDYQSRAGRIGLPSDFWTTRVKALYKVRNDEDVAHYTLDTPDHGAMVNRFGQAGAAFKDAFSAYMRVLPERGT
jgi:hypothetical protein